MISEQSSSQVQIFGTIQRDLRRSTKAGTFRKQSARRALEMQEVHRGLQ
jgi:hypothetical protein